MLRLGLVDFDSSHCVEFAQRLNQAGADPEQFVEGARVVLGCPGKSTMAPQRIETFRPQVTACGVELVDRPDDLLGRIDAALVLSLCGDAHLDSARPFLSAGVPTFVDKPFACSVRSAREMVALARNRGTLLLSSSALRFVDRLERVHAEVDRFGPVRGAIAYGPAKRDPGNPGLFHYGIHAVETLFTLLGPGCERVSTAHVDGADVVTGRWRDGRLGTIRGTRDGHAAYGFVAFCERAVIAEPLSTRFAYRNLLRRVVESFRSGRAAVEPETTLEIVRFVVAALDSERRDGAWIGLDEVEDE